MRMLFVLLVMVWLMQAAAAVAFKYGSGGKTADRRRWFWGFLGGNTVGMTSMWPAMVIYGLLADNSNLAAALVGGGSFVGNQLALAMVFHSNMSWRQWLGIALAAGGLIVSGWSMPV